MTLIRRTTIVPLLAAACALANTATAQQPPALLEPAVQLATEQQQKLNAEQDRRKGELMEFLSVDNKLVKGKPYSASSETDVVQTLADGNRIVHHTASKFYRDSNGRIRNEQTFGVVDASNTVPPETKVFIDDPVANTAYVLEPNLKTARKLTRSRKFLDELNADSNTMARVKLPKLDEGRDIVKQDLGKKVIEGVQCTGTRQTITIPAGQVGNEQPISIITDTWFAPGIAAVVQSSTSDPRFGQTSYALHNVQQGEQSSELFALPADYRLDN